MPLVIESSAALARALDSPIDPALKSLLILRRDQLTVDGFDEIGDIAKYVIACPGDTLAAVEASLGVPITVNMVDGSRYPEPAFSPNWEWCIAHPPACWEAPFIASDEGFANVLIVMNQVGVDSTLLSLCRTYCKQGDMVSQQ